MVEKTMRQLQGNSSHETIIKLYEKILKNGKRICGHGSGITGRI